MSFILDPSNHAITLVEINSMAKNFSQMIKTSSSTFKTYTYEKVNVKSVIPLLSGLVPVTSSFIKGMRIIPTLRSESAMRFLYCPTIAEFNDEFSGFTIFEYDTEQNPFDMISSNTVYWVVNDELQMLSAGDLQTATDDFQRYIDEILISHDGTGYPSSFENYVSLEDTSSTYFTLDTLQALISDNKDSSNNEPAYLYFQNTAAKVDGVYRHTAAESVFNPGATSGNNPGNGPFANKAADFHQVCPPMCNKIVALKEKLIHL